jgi:hypothetical protein
MSPTLHIICFEILPWHTVAWRSGLGKIISKRIKLLSIKQNRFIDEMLRASRAYSFCFRALLNFHHIGNEQELKGNTLLHIKQNSFERQDGSYISG